MNLTTSVKGILKVAALLVYLSFSGMFFMLEFYSVVPTGIYLKLPHTFWAGTLALLAVLQLTELVSLKPSGLQKLVPILGLWAWVVLFTATVATHGLNLAAMAYTLAILLDALILASNFPAKR